MEFTDRILKCADCGSDFVFTAGEQLFFFDKQFKNDPKRCKLCKAKRAGLGRTASGGASVALPLSRTETRTKCSACGVETTVPFKPTQGRPVLCRSCFQLKRVPAAVAAVARLDSPEGQVADAVEQALASTEAVPAALPSDGSAAATMDLIAETPASVVTDTAEAPQA
ncbi:MAG TPA: zinc-ribbon domain containing protein [Acidobacteriaceae bacterium]|jgi:CxxC-x17-CxxC domain-containing protein|nr:zinc-ribbon domain containing protein [Acidobacteriaceae bacterium]